MDAEAVYELPVGRHLAVDERGVGLRATWRLDRGFVNISLWRDDVCVEAFLTPAAAAELVGFLARGLADATAVATTASVRAISGNEAIPSRLEATLAATRRALRSRVARGLAAAASHLDHS